MRLSSSPRRRGALLAAPVLALSVAATLPGVATAHEFDHAPPGRASTTPPDPSFLSGGRDGAEVELLTTIPTGNPHSDLDFFTKGGETYASVGTLAIGGNQGGQQIIKLTQGGEVELPDGGLAPQYVTGHPSAACPSNPSAALGLQHDVEATPKAPDVFTSDSYLPADPAKAGDAQLLIDATDAGGRCHDQTTLGLTGNPRGGLEIIDITGLGTPGFGTGDNRTRELALTSHIGESHTVNVDPQRPNIAYAVTSDSVGVTQNADGTFTRNNETTQANNLDGFEVVDLTSCLTAPYGTMPPGLTLEEKREACVPQVYRYRYPNLQMSLGHTLKGTTYGCHELQMYPDDRLTCASGSAAIVFDMSGAFREETVTAPDGSRYTISRPNGTPLDCRRRDSVTAGPSASGAKVIDCVNGGADGTKNLGVPEWLKSGAPSLEGVRHIGSIHHAGRASATGFSSTRPATEDIDFNHEVEFTRSGRYLLSTDERGGGVTGGSQCSQENSTPGFANGGVNAQKTSALTTEPASIEHTDASYARSYSSTATATATTLPKAIYRAPIRTGVEGAFCTAHVMQQVPGQDRIVMGWYSQGTQVIDYVELPGGKLQYFETAYGIPGNANQWVSHVFSSKRNDDGTFTYYGATGDTVGGRNAIDIYKMTLPAPLTACDLQAGSAERAEPSTVSDRDKARSVHVANVDCVLNYKISSGKTVDASGAPTTYAPTERVTRGQMASFIANALIRSNDSDAVLPAAGNDQFSDIASDTHRAAINRLARAGIVKGLTGFGGRFAPQELITRDQMASFIVEAARFINEDRSYEPTRLDAFGDVPAGNVHERNINAGAEAGLFQGTRAAGSTARSGLFEPGTQVQRDQMATFLVNLFTASIR